MKRYVARFMQTVDFGRVRLVVPMRAVIAELHEVLDGVLELGPQHARHGVRRRRRPDDEEDDRSRPRGDDDDEPALLEEPRAEALGLD